MLIFLLSDVDGASCICLHIAQWAAVHIVSVLTLPYASARTLSNGIANPAKDLQQTAGRTSLVICQPKQFRACCAVKHVSTVMLVRFSTRASAASMLCMVFETPSLGSSIIHSRKDISSLLQGFGDPSACQRPSSQLWAGTESALDMTVC